MTGTAPADGRPVAAIDCGTNSTRLLVVGPDGASLVREMRITRLGQGVDATRVLAPDAVARTLDVLSQYRGMMGDLGVARARMAATSAVRDALNGNEFLDAASQVVGWPAELLSGEEEGALAYAGATVGLEPVGGDDVVVDIGGGSTELVVRRDGRLGVVSLDLGCVRLTERHFQHDPPTPAELQQSVATIDTELQRAERTVRALEGLRAHSRLIGLAGTVSTLAMLDMGLADYTWSAVHHTVLPLTAVEHWCTVLAAEPAAARGQRPGMVPGREDVILGGALVLREVMARWGFADCLVSESDILDGLAASLRSEPRGAATGHDGSGDEDSAEYDR